MSDLDYYAKLAYYEGIYTIRNIVHETSDDLFFFSEASNMVSGYIDASSEKTLSVLSNKKKLVVSMVNSFYHSVLDNISEVIYALEAYPKHELIIDISETQKDLESVRHGGFVYHNVFLYFLETLKMKKIKYRLVSLKDYDIIYMNNFRIIGYQLDTIQKADIGVNPYNNGTEI
jgi:hypothetical protein